MPIEQLVAEHVAQAVVHQLEAIEIQEQHGEQAVRRRLTRASTRRPADPGTARDWAARSADRTPCLR